MKVSIWVTTSVSAAFTMTVSVIIIKEKKIKTFIPHVKFSPFINIFPGLDLAPSEGSQTSGSSLHSGSEFEEFLPTKGLIQYHAVILKVKFNSSSSKVHRISKLQYLPKYQTDLFRKNLILPSV